MTTTVRSCGTGPANENFGARRSALIRPGPGNLEVQLREVIRAQVLQSRGEVHALYAPMVEAAKRVANDSSALPDLRGFALGLLDLIGSRS